MNIDDGNDRSDGGRPERPTQDAPDADGVARDGAGAAIGWARLRRRRTVGWIAGALVVLLVVLGAVYYKTTDDAADQVVLRWRQSAPDCGNAKVRPAKDDSSGGFTPAAIVVTEGLRCTIVVEVLNNSERSIHLDHAVAQGMGRETGSVVRVDSRTHPQREHRSDLGLDRFGLDAYVEINSPEGLDLDAGHSTTFQVDLVFNPEGCVMGATTWVDAWPEVFFAVMGRDFARPAANSLSFFHRGRTPGCDNLEEG